VCLGLQCTNIHTGRRNRNIACATNGIHIEISSSSTATSQLGRFSSFKIFAVKLVAAPSRRLCCFSVLDDSLARERVAVCKLAKGDRIPPTTLKDQDGRKVSLSKFKDRPLVLYFYPVDESQGCTKHAYSFRDSYEQFKKDVLKLSVSVVIVMNLLRNSRPNTDCHTRC
jgi:hypothetical protein